MRTTSIPLVLLVGVLAACGHGSRTNPDPDAIGSSDAASDGPSDGPGDGPPGPPGTACGGRAGEACAVTEYCDYADNDCGVGDGAGTCRRRPDACSALVGSPVCACDGNLYPDECLAASSGFDLNAHGTCEIPDHFGCGYTLCDLQTEYCRREVAPGAADVFECIALPPACMRQTPDCTCLNKERCGTSCTGDARVGMTLTCS